MKINTFVNTTSIISLLLLLAACGLHDDNDDNAADDEITTITDRPWLLEEEFDADVTLHATNLQTVVLHLEGSSLEGSSQQSTGIEASDNAIVKNSIRFVVEKERSHSFCVAEDEQHILRIELIRNGGDTVIKSDRGGACESVTLEEGRYLLNIYHDGRDIGSAGVTAFLHQPAPLGVSSTPTNYYTLPTMDFWVFRDSNGAFVGNGAFESAEQLVASSQIVRESEVWEPVAVSRTKFELKNKAEGHLVKFCIDGGSAGVATVLFTGTTVETCKTAANGNVEPSQTATFRQSDAIGGGLFAFDWNFNSTLSNSGIILVSPVKVNKNKLIQWQRIESSEVIDTNKYTTEYEGYNCDKPCVDDTTLPLAAGQIALYKECNYQGPAFVFMADVDDMSIYKDAATAGLGIKNDEARSIRLGEETVALLYSKTNLAGTLQPIIQNTPCLDVTVLGNDKLNSFQVINESAIDYIVSAQGCRNCILTGIDLSNQDFTDYNFTSAVFIGANLDGTNFSNAELHYAELSSTGSASQVTSMVGTNFDNPIMHCTSFSGSDISQAIFIGLHRITDFSCYLDLSGATINYISLWKDSWRYMDLSASTMINVPATLSTIDEPLDLSGGIFSNVNWLAGKKLDGVNLGCYALEEDQTTVCPAPNGNKFCSTLQGIDLVGTSLIDACMKQAAMEGAFLSASNLDGADLSGVQLKAIDEGNPATLEGAFMRNVNLSGADLTGVNANNVNFYTVAGGTADATGVIATGADFSGSYLAFADFSGSTSNLQSTTWTNTMLLGADFEQADLSTNTSGGVNSGTATKFNGAYMQGTNFADAIIDNVNFTSTYWDALGSGGELNFLMPKQNLGFSGYWKVISLPECPMPLKYNAGNPPPMDVTNSNNTCPNGGPGPCDNVWDDPLQSINLAFFQSTVPPDFPQDPSASSENQCSSSFSDPNPVDFCWTTTNNPTFCSENLLNE